MSYFDDLKRAIFSSRNPESRGGTRRIGDVPSVERCRHPEHGPATHEAFQPGVYEHECPSCGHVTRFVVHEGPTLCAAKGAGS